MRHEIERLDIGETLSLSVANIRQWSRKFAVIAAVYAVFAAQLRVSNFGFYTLLDGFFGVLLSVAATHAALQTMYESDYTGKARILAPVGLGILSTVCIFIGLLLLIAPGLLLFVAWAVALPALLREDLGVFGALGRSWTVTLGNRWRILGLGFLLVVPIRFLSSFVTRMGTTFFGGEASDNFLFQLFVHLLVGVGTLFTAVCWTEAYVTLTGRNDRINRLQDIFA